MNSLLREYLAKRLRSLHREAVKYSEPVDAASTEGAITELELLWAEILQEDAPTKKELFKKQKAN